MFGQMLSVQWKWSRWSVLLLSLAVIVVAIWSISVDLQNSLEMQSGLAQRLEAANGWYHTLVWVGGFLLAMHAWRTDHAGRHVYALSLPIPRHRFVLYRYVSGLLFAGLIVLTLWLAALVATSMIEVPPGLNAYPTGLALRIGVALLATYALFFAVWSATPRTGYYVAGILILFVVVNSLSPTPVGNVLQSGLSALWSGLGFEHIMTGRWFLIDV
ncbi:MAG: ABC-2 transporter permease [Gemmatimonadota bacterium]